MSSFEQFQRASTEAQEKIFSAAVKAEAARLVSEGKAPTDPAPAPSSRTVFPVEQFSGNGVAYSTMHYPDPERHPEVALTAFHADITAVREDLERKLDLRCFRVERSDEDLRYFLDATPDVHVFARDRAAAEAFKESCPHPDEVSQAMGFSTPSYLNENPDLDPTVVARGFPAGYDDGPAQARHLVPYLIQNIASTSGLHTFYSKRAADPREYGIMIGGNSGGEARVLKPVANRGALGAAGTYLGVVVRRGLQQGRHLAVVQPVHNKIVLV